MKNTKWFMLCAFVFGFVSVLFVTGVAYAYNEESWNTYSPTYAYDATWPGGDWPNRATDAHTRWNNVSPTSFAWSYNSGATGKVEYKALCCGRLGETGYHWAGIPLFSSITAAFPRIQSSGYSWYTAGTGSPSGTQYDLLSVLTHEFGHASGHYEHSTDGTCSGSSGPTMCPAISAGQVHWRSLETEDNNRLNAVYP